MVFAGIRDSQEHRAQGALLQRPAELDEQAIL
jgi:hypothetical protein